MEKPNTLTSNSIFLQKVQKNGDVMLIYCKSENQLADLFTKPLLVSRFEFLKQKIRICNS
jgi:hypothetical protein